MGRRVRLGLWTHGGEHQPLVGFDKLHRLQAAKAAFCIGPVPVQLRQMRSRLCNQGFEMGDLACGLVSQAGPGEVLTKEVASLAAASQRGARGKRIVNTVPVSAAD